ncbi:hypothetical protein Agub_g13153 [Astrephomene gubernaculifera]|uniref:Uncharacterized protein n=1 Tax=Astrephomene gubernaculifera TaxID=47775 RepID=A0AAD3E3T5_9CHLO|nr:hypothetical protein Agub_g13153 [Astrephomene gubernaculifera]
MGAPITPEFVRQLASSLSVSNPAEWSLAYALAGVPLPSGWTPIVHADGTVAFLASGSRSPQQEHPLLDTALRALEQLRASQDTSAGTATLLGPFEDLDAPAPELFFLDVQTDERIPESDCSRDAIIPELPQDVLQLLLEGANEYVEGPQGQEQQAEEAGAGALGAAAAEEEDGIDATTEPDAATVGEAAATSDGAQGERPKDAASVNPDTDADDYADDDFDDASQRATGSDQESRPGSQRSNSAASLCGSTPAKSPLIPAAGNGSRPSSRADGGGAAAAAAAGGSRASSVIGDGGGGGGVLGSASSVVAEASAAGASTSDCLPYSAAVSPLQPSSKPPLTSSDSASAAAQEEDEAYAASRGSGGAGGGDGGSGGGGSGSRVQSDVGEVVGSFAGDVDRAPSCVSGRSSSSSAGGRSSSGSAAGRSGRRGPPPVPPPSGRLSFFGWWFEDIESSDLTFRIDSTPQAGGGLAPRHCTLSYDFASATFSFVVRDPVTPPAPGQPHERVPELRIPGLSGDQVVITDTNRPADVWDLHLGARLRVLGKPLVLKNSDLATAQWHAGYFRQLKALRDQLAQEVQKYKPRVLRPGLVTDKGAVRQQAGQQLRHVAGQVAELIEDLRQYRPAKAESFMAALPIVL